MDRLTYFIGKFWTFVTSFHPLTLLTIFIVGGLMFFIIRQTLLPHSPRTRTVNILAATLTIFLGLPLLGLILLFIFGLLLKDQPF